MPVFDFNDAPDKKNPAECTYTTFQSSEPEASPEEADSDSGQQQAKMAASFLWNVYESGQAHHL